MIPRRDNIPTRRFPLITVALIAANIAVFLADRATGHLERVQVYVPGEGIARGIHFIGGYSESYSLIPARITSNLAESWPTIFASMFLHANWLHIGGNMLMLWVFGNNVEDTLGRLRYLLFYFVCG